MNTHHPFIKLRYNWLLALFLIIPTTLLIAWVDMTMLDYYLLPYMGLGGLLIPLYLLFFEMPHIFASFVGFVDKEYANVYKKHLIFGLPGLLAVFGLLLWFDFELAVGVYLAATMYHVMRQQTGIALLFGVAKDSWHSWWSWSLVIGTALVYVGLMSPSLLADFSYQSIQFVAIGLLILATILGIKLISLSSTKRGIWYTIFTLTMVASSYYLLWAGYIFLAVFVMRFVHDVTAFMFYITHEMNRNKDKIKNFLYHYIPFLPHSLIFLVPALAVFLGLLLREGVQDPKLLFVMIMMFAFMHYYLESVMWKRDAPHRKQVQVI